MNNNDTISEKLSFWQLIQQTKIEIPIIQRDYAQGREDMSEIRNNFLDALSLATKTNVPIELDFVYGSKKDNNLKPLDGQQRLTTLFLLHWYLACKENSLNESNEILKKFTYETRTSSREFCKELVTKGIDFENLLIPDENKNNQVSKSIINASWFFLSWEKDPTIKAMLIMLDAIHERFANADFTWKKLIDEDKITFLYIELKNFGLSDDLYIKMNARGKALTEFENFKALLEKKIVEENWERDVDFINRFSLKIDTSWTDLFWLKDKHFILDNLLIKFISGNVLYALAIKALGNKIKEERIQTLFNKPTTVKPDDFDEETFKYLCTLFNKYHSIQNKSLSLKSPYWQFIPENFSNLLSILTQQENPTYPQRVLFYAQSAYLLRNESLDQILFNDWMRVVRNIVQNSTIDSAAPFISAINLIRELSEGCENIYQHLGKSKGINSNFASLQVKEEIMKAEIITKNEENKSIIHEIEDTNFFKGRISFALHCIDYSNGEDVFDRTKLEKIKEVVKKYLEGNDITNEFRRGLLTIGDNNFYNYWWSWSYSTETNKRCLIENINDLKTFSTNVNFRHYLKELINQLIEMKLGDLINDFVPSSQMPNWKKSLIKDPMYLEYWCQSHYLGITTDDAICFLFQNKKRPRSREDCFPV